MAKDDMVDADLPSRDAAKEFYAKYEPKEALGRWGYRKCTPSSIPLLLRHPLYFSLALSLFLVHIYIYVCTFSQYFGTLVSVVVIWCKKNVSLAYIALSLATLWCTYMYEWPSLFTDCMNTSLPNFGKQCLYFPVPYSDLMMMVVTREFLVSGDHLR